MATSPLLPASPRLPEDSSAVGPEVSDREGLIVVHTGTGKGKTTAALGLMTRAWGHGMRVGVIQFLKSADSDTGESRAARRMDIDWISTGEGFAWEQGGLERGRAAAQRGWDLVRHRAATGEYDVLILDELTHAVQLGWVEESEVVRWLGEERPPGLHVVITGAAAPPALIERADLVTEMRLVKHPYVDRGLGAQAGIEY